MLDDGRRRQKFYGLMMDDECHILNIFNRLRMLDLLWVWSIY
jgi:hypothetical protein